jgi:hypothetical protein
VPLQHISVVTEHTAYSIEQYLLHVLGHCKEPFHLAFKLCLFKPIDRINFIELQFKLLDRIFET